MFIAIMLITAGVAAVACSLVAAHRLRAPWDTVASLAMPAGVVLAGIGIVLLVAPDFFTR